MKFKATILSSALLFTTLSGCATMQGMMGMDPSNERNRPIHNPFGDFYTGATTDPNQNLILRTKKGDRSVEIELPGTSHDLTDFAIPMSPAFAENGKSGRNPASVGGTSDGSSSDGALPTQGTSAIDESLKDRTPSNADREITGTLPQGPAEDEGRRREIEQGLGLVPSDALDSAPGNKSYLAQVDHIKQLYRTGRFEAALLEVDDNLKLYQTDPRLYEMRGTLLDRLGRTDLAVKSWKQALKFDPNNQALRRFVERKEKRSLASP